MLHLLPCILLQRYQKMVCRGFGGEDAGGFVMWAGTWRVVGVLVVSRAFGDKLLKQFVVVVPEIQEEMNNNGVEFFHHVK